MSVLAWTVGSPSASLPRIPIPIFNVPNGPPSHIRFLGQPRCCFVHGVGRRSFPCVLPRFDCPLCKDHNPKIPAGYAPAQLWAMGPNSKLDWLTVVCCLTDCALEKLRAADLRGAVYALKRRDARYNAKLEADFHLKNLIALAAEFEPMPIVERAWVNYLCTFTTPAALPGNPDPVLLVVDPGKLVSGLGDHMAEEQDQADQARRKKGGAL